MGSLSKRGCRMDSVKNAFKVIIIVITAFISLLCLFIAIFPLLLFPIMPHELLAFACGILATAALTLAYLWRGEKSSRARGTTWSLDSLFKRADYLITYFLVAGLVVWLVQAFVDLSIGSFPGLKLTLFWLLAITTIAFAFLWVREKFFRKK
jgi:hypothetical protein